MANARKVYEQSFLSAQNTQPSTWDLLIFKSVLIESIDLYINQFSRAYTLFGYFSSYCSQNGPGAGVLRAQKLRKQIEDAQCQEVLYRILYGHLKRDEQASVFGISLTDKHEGNLLKESLDTFIILGLKKNNFTSGYYELEDPEILLKKEETLMYAKGLILAKLKEDIQPNKNNKP